MAKTLFQRGADFVDSMVFMFASTNLVVELGIVLWVLMGWQFALAEFVGGVIMIVLFVLLARGSHEAAGDRGGSREQWATAATCTVRDDRAGDGGSGVKSPAGWADAASYTFADAKMLRKEMAAGYLVAGFLAVLVPVSVWNNIFLPGTASGRRSRTSSSARSSRSSASSARSGTCRSPPRSGTAASASAA